MRRVTHLGNRPALHVSVVNRIRGHHGVAVLRQIRPGCLVAHHRPRPRRARDRARHQESTARHDKSQHRPPHEAAADRASRHAGADSEWTCELHRHAPGDSQQLEEGGDHNERRVGAPLIRFLSRDASNDGVLVAVGCGLRQRPVPRGRRIQVSI